MDLLGPEVAFKNCADPLQNIINLSVKKIQLEEKVTLATIVGLCSEAKEKSTQQEFSSRTSCNYGYNVYKWEKQALKQINKI